MYLTIYLDEEEERISKEFLLETQEQSDEDDFRDNSVLHQ